jgi:hypothetical protein
MPKWSMARVCIARPDRVSRGVEGLPRRCDAGHCTGVIGFEEHRLALHQQDASGNERVVLAILVGQNLCFASQRRRLSRVALPQIPGQRHEQLRSSRPLLAVQARLHLLDVLAQSEEIHAVPPSR